MRRSRTAPPSPLAQGCTYQEVDLLEIILAVSDPPGPVAPFVVSSSKLNAVSSGRCQYPGSAPEDVLARDRELGRRAIVAVVEPADPRSRDDSSNRRRHDRPQDRRVFPEC